MTDSIELLASIGGNASLRHASPRDLHAALEGMHADAMLLRAANSGDAGGLRERLGIKHMSVNQSPPTPPPPARRKRPRTPPPPPPPQEPER